MLPPLLIIIAAVFALHWGVSKILTDAEASRVLGIICGVVVGVLAILLLVQAVPLALH
jgi:flagellar biogenesis protein FliO